MAKPFAWSFSSLELFELCRKKFYHAKIKRDYKEVFGTEANYGKEVHKAFEDRLISGKRLPLDLTHHEKVMKRLADAPGEGMPEQKLALTIGLEPTGFFDDDVWARCIIDYVKVNGKVLLIIDHKTGKQKEGFDQVDLQAAMMAAYMPEIENFIVGYYWTKTKSIITTKFTREGVTEVWNNFLPRVEELQHAVKIGEFPPTKNFLCKRHCPCSGCVHWGV